MIKAVLFDLDGTLANTLEDLGCSTNFALRQFGCYEQPIEKFKYFVGNGMKKLIERALPEEKRDEATTNKVLQVFMNHYREHFADKTVAYDGITDLVSSLKQKDMKIAVVTNKAHEMAIQVTEKLFGDTFEIVCGKKDDFPAKPDPMLTLQIISEMGFEPKECLFVGDSGVDAQTAVNAGCIGVGVLWGFREREELVRNGATYIVERPAQILDIIEELNK